MKRIRIFSLKNVEQHAGSITQAAAGSTTQAVAGSTTPAAVGSTTQATSGFASSGQASQQGLILNGLTKDFAGFVRNYNMHNMGKTIGELHAMLIEYEKGLPKKAETPQVMMIKGGKIQKANKKSLKA
ncbi:hypothetical protein Tco_0826996 [Tanacetum coccineum]